MEKTKKVIEMLDNWYGRQYLLGKEYDGSHYANPTEMKIGYGLTYQDILDARAELGMGKFENPQKKW